MGLINNPFSSENKFEAKVQEQELQLKKVEIDQNQMQIDKDIAYPQGDPNEFTMDQARADLIKWQQDMSKDMQKMCNQLRNWFKNLETGVWEPKRINGKSMRPLCNEECIAELSAIIEPTISRNLMMSRYDRDFIRQKLIDLSNRITLLLIENRRRFQILMCDLTPIITVCQGTFEPAHFRALGGGDRNYVGGVHRHVITQQDREGEDKPKKKGVFF